MTSSRLPITSLTSTMVAAQGVGGTATASARIGASLNADDLRRFARRDWTTAATRKRDYWAEQYRQFGAAPARRASAALAAHMHAVQPDFPSSRQRDRDLADHASLRQRLDRAANAFTSR